MKYYCLTCGKPTSYTLNLPKFCSECGVPTIGAQFKKPTIADLQQNHRPPADPRPNEPRIIPVDKMSMAREEQEVQAEEGLLYPTNKFKVTIEGGRNQPQREEYHKESEIESSEDIDSEYFDTSKFKNIKPKFKIETFAKSSDSLEGLLTQGAMMNSKPEPIQYQTGPAMSEQQVLEEFKREAGASRQQ